jgi:hypothetical protein
LCICGASTRLIQQYINQINIDRRKTTGHL